VAASAAASVSNIRRTEMSCVATSPSSPRLDRYWRMALRECHSSRGLTTDPIPDVTRMMPWVVRIRSASRTVTRLTS
jgi:hypothetical protein